MKNCQNSTVGAQSVAQACQNFVNWPRNFSAHRRLRKLTLLFAKKAYKSKQQNFHIFNIPKGEAFMYIILIINIVSLFWVCFLGQNWSALYFCAHHTLCTGRVSLVAKLRLNDHFPQNIFSPLGNENVGRGTRVLSESGFKVTKITTTKNYCQQNFDKN